MLTVTLSGLEANLTGRRDGVACHTSDGNKVTVRQAEEFMFIFQGISSDMAYDPQATISGHL